MEINLTNSSKKAIIDDRDYDIVKKYNWFYDKKHVYAHITMPTDDPKTKPERLKIRLDRYIFRFTTHNFIDILHRAYDEGLNNQRNDLFPDINKKAAGTRGMTRYLGVKRVKGFIVAKYEDKKNKIEEVKKYACKQNSLPVEWMPIERTAARQYDEWARLYKGIKAKTNFLPDAIYK